MVMEPGVLTDVNWNNISGFIRVVTSVTDDICRQRGTPGHVQATGLGDRH